MMRYFDNSGLVAVSRLALKSKALKDWFDEAARVDCRGFLPRVGQVEAEVGWDPVLHLVARWQAVSCLSLKLPGAE